MRAPVTRCVQVAARLGDTVTLRCSARGLPPPSVHWYKSVGSLRGEVACGGECLTIPRYNYFRYLSYPLSQCSVCSLSLAAAGDYLCSASNGVGHPAHASIHVAVMCE